MRLDVVISTKCMHIELVVICIPMDFEAAFKLVIISSSIRIIITVMNNWDYRYLRPRVCASDSGPLCLCVTLEG